MQSQFTLLQEILVSVKTMLEQVNTLKDQQIVLFNQYKDLFADAQKNGGIQPGTAETAEQQAALADDASVATQEELQNWIEQQQTIRQILNFKNDDSGKYSTPWNGPIRWIPIHPPLTVNRVLSASVHRTKNI